MRLAVLHGSNDLYGASRVLLGDVTGWRADGHDVEVFLPYDGPLIEPLESVGARVHVQRLHVLRRVEPRSSMVAPVSAFASLPRWSATPDVVVLWTLPLVPYLAPLRLRRHRVIVSVHELEPGPAGAGLAAVTGLLANAVQANSHAVADWLGGRGVPRDRIVVAYPAAPPFDPVADREQDGQVRILLPGRISARKGQVEFVQLCRAVREVTGVDVRVTVAGAPFPADSSARARFEQAISGIDWVTYAGEVPDVRVLYADHDLVASFPQAPESFGLMPLEAWSAGRRSVARPLGGLAEALRLADGVALTEGDERDVLARVVTDARWRTPPSGDEPAAMLATAEARRESWAALLRRSRP